MYNKRVKLGDLKKMGCNLVTAKNAVSRKLKTEVSKFHWDSACRTLKFGKGYDDFSEQDLENIYQVILFKKEFPYKKWKSSETESRREKARVRRELKDLRDNLEVERADGKVLGKHLGAWILEKFGVTVSTMHLRNMYSKFSFHEYVDPKNATETIVDVNDIRLGQIKFPSLKGNGNAPPGYIWGKDLVAWMEKNKIERCISTIRSRLAARDIPSRNYCLIPLKDLKEVAANDDYKRVPEIQVGTWEGEVSRKAVYRHLRDLYKEKDKHLDQPTWRASVFSALKQDTRIHQRLPEGFTREQVLEIVEEIKKRFAKHP